MRTLPHTILLLAGLTSSALAGPAPAKGGGKPAPQKPAPRAMRTPLSVTSPAFIPNGPIPSEYTCEGAEVAPPIEWTAAPTGTRSIALLVEDVDAPNGPFTHWLITGLPPTQRSLTAGGAVPGGAIAAKNDKGTDGWTGPCPPSGRHRYVFHVFALDMPLAKAMNRTALLEAITGHVIASGQVIGTYEKSRR